jgi:hypothetical protein
MRLSTRTLAAALVAAAVPLYVGPAAAAPLSQSLSLSKSDFGSIEQVQYRRWNGGWYRGGRWIGPAAAGLAAGAIVGGAIAASRYNDGYYAYGAVPGPYASGPYAYGAGAPYSAYGAAPYRGYYAYGAGPYSSNTRLSPQWGSCTGDRDDDSAFPTWACR